MTRLAKHRFYVPPSEWGDETIQLGDEEAHHCRDVMRCQTGDRIAVFNGQGIESETEITELSRKRIILKKLSEIETPPLPAQITLGQAIPKGKNMDLIIQKATELGISRIVPIESTNTVVHLKEKDGIKKQEKWQRIAIEACKQCGQNWLPTVEVPTTVEKYTSERRSESLNIIAAIDPQSLPFKKIISQCDTTPTTASMLIGPEGDFTQEEVECATGKDFHPMSLGPIILRSETAAIFALSLLVYELMER